MLISLAAARLTVASCFSSSEAFKVARLLRGFITEQSWFEAAVDERDFSYEIWAILLRL